MKSILHRYSMPTGAKLSLALNEPKKVALHSTSKTIPKHAPRINRDY
jgi:hypothetical protein